MTKVKNVSNGPRGIWSANDGLVMIDAGRSANVEVAAGEEPGEWFTFDEGEAAEPGPLDMNLDDLTAHVATLEDPDAIQALIDAETAGKSRKGALAALEARRDELLAA